jgi:predicted ATPase
MTDSRPFLRRVSIRNYKSIAECDVDLGKFTVIVGRNGSGKSNFLDAIRFVADGLGTSLDHAMKSRGGIEEVRRRSTGHPHNFSIHLVFGLQGDRECEYRFEIAAQKRGGFRVREEQLTVHLPTGSSQGFRIVDGRLCGVDSGDEPLEATLFPHVETRGRYEHLPKPLSDRLYLVSVSGLSEFRDAYDALLAMGFYNLNPEQIKELQSPDAGELLRRDGSNLASVIGRLTEEASGLKDRIREYLKVIVPDLIDFDRKALANRETIEFRQDVKGATHPWRFYAASMSDGTLRVLGVLVAVMQLAGGGTAVRLAGIEEPETALHPAAAKALLEALREAAEHTQVIITSHSPELVDGFNPDTDTLIVATKTQGTTEIGPVDSASAEAIRSHLYTAGELLRMDQLQPQSSTSGTLEFDFESVELPAVETTP